VDDDTLSPALPPLRPPCTCTAETKCRVCHAYDGTTPRHAKSRVPAAEMLLRTRVRWAAANGRLARHLEITPPAVFLGAWRARRDRLRQSLARLTKLLATLEGKVG
jgi:hypothetical protein